MQEFLEVAGKQIEVDANGYLLDHTEWDTEIAEIIAQKELIELSDAHWEVVLFVREFYKEYDKRRKLLAFRSQQNAYKQGLCRR